MDFKVRCIDDCGSGFKINSVYEVVDGIICFEDGSRCDTRFYNLEEINKELVSQFELVTDKPRLCEILGVENEQDFIFDRKHYIITAGADKEKRVYLNDGVGDHFDAYIICDMINHPDKIIRQSQFSEDEKALMRLYVGAGYSVIERRELNLWVWKNSTKTGCLLPYSMFPQIIVENSPFDAKTYLEGLK